MTGICYSPIGTIHSPFTKVTGMPIQSKAAEGVQGWVELDEALVGGLKDLDGFSHLILLYHFHLSEGYSLEVKPFLDTELRGVFSTRAPRRPNPIGMSLVRLKKVEGNILEIEDVDVVDGTPLLDIKPYVPEFDFRRAEKTGWLAGKAEAAAGVISDERFK